MMCKSFLLLLALCAAQGVIDARTSPPSYGPPAQTYDSPLDEFIKVINKLLKVIDEQIDEAVQSLPQLHDDLKEASASAVDGIETLVNGVIDDGLAVIDALVAEAESVGVDVDLCVIGRREKINEIAKDIVGGTTACVRTNLAQGDAAIDLAIKQIQSINNAINVLQKSFDECNGNGACQWDVLGKGIELLQTLPTEIRNFLEQAKYKIERIVKDFGLCIEKSHEKIESRLRPLIDDIEQCIREKLPGGRAVEPTNFGIVDKIVELLGKLTSKVTEIAKNILAAAKDLTNAVNETAQKVLSDAVETVQAIIKVGLDQVNKVAEEAEKNGFDVAICVKTVNQEVNALADAALDSTSKCVTDTMDKVEANIQGALQMADDAVDEVDALNAEVQACNGDDACLGKMLGKIVKAGARLPLELGKALAKITKLAIDSKVDLAKCLASNTIDLSKKVAPIINNALTCIHDKITN